MAGDFPNISPHLASQWPEPNSIDPVIRTWYPEFGIVLAVCTTVLLCARILSQIRRSTNGFGVDDGFICVAWLFASLFTALSVIGVFKYGFDRHVWDVPDHLLGRAALVQWLSEGVFVLSTCSTKISVLCFFSRLEPPTTRALKRIVYVFMAFTAGYSAACLLAQTLLCHPISAYWEIPEPNGLYHRSCTSQHTYYPLQGSLGSFSSLYSMAIPVLTLRNRPMSQYQRIGLRTVSVLGLCVVGIGITRTVFLCRLEDSTNGDATWNGYNVFVWSQLESQLSLMAASIPYLQRFVSQYPGGPIVYSYPSTKERIDSVVSRVSSTLRFTRSTSPRNIDISTPQVVEIPEWEFDSMESPRPAHLPVGEITYDRYVQGMFGPPAPPKDSVQYRREHGEMV